MPGLTSRVVPVARTEDGIDMTSASRSVWLDDQIGHHLVMHEPAIFQAQDVVGARRRERELQAVQIAWHRLGLRHHLQCWVVDPEPVVYIRARDLELDGLTDDEIGSFDRPGPLRPRR